MSDTQTRINSIVTAGVIALCLVAMAVIFLLPADSLVIDLVYQGF